MKNLLLRIVAVSTVILSTLNSCSKHEYRPINSTDGSTSWPTTLSLTTDQWESRGGGIFVNTFKNVIPPEDANRWVKIYLGSISNDMLINRPIRFMDGAVWASRTVTDIMIFYRGTSDVAPHLNIKVMFE